MPRRALILIEISPSDVGPLYAQAAQRLGLHPVILSTDPARYNCLGAESIKAVRVDTDNLDALIQECSRLRATYDIAGITSTGDSFYATVGKLCRHFDLPGPNAASVERCRDKFVQRQLLGAAGVPMPAYRLAANAMDVERSAAEIGLPVILKPAVGSFSCGVRLCHTVDELAEHTNYLLGGKHIWQSSPRILVEEFAQGSFYWADIMGDEVIGIGTADVGDPPYFVFRGFTLPAPLTDEDHNRIADVSLSCLRALGLGWGPTGIELRWAKRGPVVIEVNPRLHCTPTPQLIQLAYGVDVVTEHIKLAIGDQWDLHKRQLHTAAARVLVPDRDGTIDSIVGESRAAAIAGVAEVKFYVEPKTPFVRKGDSRDWIGHVIAASPSRAQTEAILERAVDLIDWSITPCFDLHMDRL
ncbi:acetyl-CoA carboxylase biotin carboxylase subunit family protein [Mesorhizobium sp. M0041]|uniref:ATP-grasp domain-containing protein n=1 Tax=Mesorhizobium sp. M0041 TaxID=2956856 RepID=UPI00333826B9